jgi:hypothetical protein
MKCIYYLSPNLDITHTISDHLHEVGVKDRFLHVISNDEFGLKKERIHSSNYLETLDLLRHGIIGAAVGFIIGLIAAGIVMAFELFGADVPYYVYLIIVAVITLFGSWEGGLTGIANSNKKLALFHDDLEAGKYLILIYAWKEQEETVKKMMREKHSAAELVAIDPHFFNPLRGLQRIQSSA